MVNNKLDQIELIEITPTLEQIEDLYIQLKERLYSISHKTLPSFNQHKNFVINNPYRAWFMINGASGSIGNVYVQSDNSIGLNCKDDININQIKAVLLMITNKLAPLHASASVRYGGYFLNVSTENTILQKKLLELGLIEVQRTYVIDGDNLKI